MFGYSPYSWKTMPMLRSRGGLAVTSRPSMRIVPESGDSRPQIRRRIVVLPPPDGPRSTKNSASETSKLTSSTMLFPASCLLRRLTCTPDTASLPPLRGSFAGHQAEIARGVRTGDHDGHDQYQPTERDRPHDQRNRCHERRDQRFRRVAPLQQYRDTDHRDDVRVRMGG